MSLESSPLELNGTAYTRLCSVTYHIVLEILSYMSV